MILKLNLKNKLSEDIDNQFLKYELLSTFIIFKKLNWITYHSDKNYILI